MRAPFRVAPTLINDFCHPKKWNYHCFFANNEDLFLKDAENQSSNNNDNLGYFGVWKNQKAKEW